MAPLDGTIVAVALPKIGPALHLGFTSSLWVQTSYLLALTAALVPSGRMADRFGALRVYRIGVVVFVVSSMMAGLAGSAASMLVARTAEGVGAAVLSSTTTVLVTEAVPPKERGRALGINVTAVYLGIALGPVLGGLLADGLGWRWIFFVNAPMGVATLLAGMRLRTPPPQRSVNLDMPGMVLIVLALAALLVGVSFAPLEGWSAPSTLAPVLLAAAAAVGFVVWEQRVDAPLVDVSFLVRNEPARTGVLSALAVYAALFATTVLTATYLEVAEGRSATAAGLLLVTQPLVVVFLSPLAGRWSDKAGSRPLVALGGAMLCAGLLLLARLQPTTSVWVTAGDLAVLGCGMAAFNSPNSSIVMGAADPSKLGVAAGTLATARFLGQSLSVALLGGLAGLSLGREGQRLLFEGQVPPLLRGAYVAGYRRAMLVAAGVAASVVLLQALQVVLAGRPGRRKRLSGP